MSQIPDPESCYAAGRKHGLAGKAPMPENAKWAQAYMTGWRHGRAEKAAESRTDVSTDPAGGLRASGCGLA